MIQRPRTKQRKQQIFFAFFSILLFSFSLQLKQAQAEKANTKQAKAAKKVALPTQTAKTKKPTPAKNQADKLAKAFQPVDLSKMKASPGWDRPYLLAAYGLCWLAILIYLFGLAKRVGTTDNQLKQIEKRLALLESDED